MPVRHTVHFEQDESGWWVASIPEVAGCHTQGRTLDEARTRIREALAAAIDDEDRERIAAEAVLDEKIVS